MKISAAGLIPLMATVLYCFPVSELRAQTDDFNDGNDVGWLHYDPIGTGNWSFPDGAYRLQSVPSPSPGTVGPGRVGSLLAGVEYSLFEATVDVVNHDANLPQIFGLIMRAGTPGLGTTIGYVFAYENTSTKTLQMQRITGERASADLGETPFTMDPTNKYRLLFRGEGPKLRGEVYNLDDLRTPLAVLEAEDPTYPSGLVGVFAYDQSRQGTNRVDVTFDNFFVGEARPKLKIDPQPFGDVMVSWPAWASNYVAEITRSLAPTNWQPVTSQTEEAEGRRFILESGSEGNAFYRLRKSGP